MFIQTEETPNPATLKFLPGREVMERGTADFAAADKAARSPLAQSLFARGRRARVPRQRFRHRHQGRDSDWPA